MKISFKKFFASMIALSIIFLPLLTSAVEGVGLTTGCGVGKVNDSKTGLGQACDFNQLMLMINKVIDFLLFYMVTPFAALLIAYAGWLMITSGGSSEAATKAKNIATNLVIGYIIALAAWLIVKTIMSSLGFNGETFLK